MIFGLAYGRGAKAIAFEVKMEGVHISVEEAQVIIDTVLGMYPGLVAFFEACRQRVQEPGWLCHCFGRFRRFPVTNDRSLQGEFERQGQNFPIQGMIASAMDRAIAYMQDYRDNVLGIPDMFRLVLQIHDAVLLAVPYEHVERVCKEVLPLNMGQRVPIYPTDLAGVPNGEGPYYLGAEIDVFHHWGEKLTYEEAVAWNIPLEYASEQKKAA